MLQVKQGDVDIYNKKDNLKFWYNILKTLYSSHNWPLHYPHFKSNHENYSSLIQITVICARNSPSLPFKNITIKKNTKTKFPIIPIQQSRETFPFLEIACNTAISVPSRDHRPITCLATKEKMFMHATPPVVVLEEEIHNIWQSLSFASVILKRRNP